MQENISRWPMLFGQDGTWFWAMLQFIVLVIALAFIYEQMRRQSAAWTCALLADFQARWDSATLLRARYLYCNSWVYGTKEFDAVAALIADLLEAWGRSLALPVTPPEVRQAIQAKPIAFYYLMFKPELEIMRRIRKDPDFYQSFERVAAGLHTSAAPGAPPLAKPYDELQAFALNEIRLAKAILKIDKDEEKLVAEAHYCYCSGE